MENDTDLMRTPVSITTTSIPVVLNGTEVAQNVLAGDPDKGELTVALSSPLIPDNAVLVETPRGLMLSVEGVGNVSYGNIVTTTDAQGRQLLPVTLFTDSALEGAQGGVVFENSVDTSHISVGDHQLESVDTVGNADLPLPTVTTAITTTVTEEPKKRKGGWPKGKRRKNLPELNAPRAPMTGYVLYAIERRQEIKESNPEIPFAEVTKILGQEWSNMSAEKKQKYLDEAEADKQRYIKELQAFQQSETYQNFLKKKKLKGLCGEENGTLDNSDTYPALIDLEEDCVNELYCRVCNLYFSSLHNKKEHMFGRQHLQAITGELEKELEKQQQQQSMSATFPMTADLATDSMTSLSDNGETANCSRLAGPVDIESFIQTFFQKNLEREQEIRVLTRSQKVLHEHHLNLCKEFEELQDYHDKLAQSAKNLKAYTTSLTAQIVGLKMVPTLFGVINF